MNKLSLRQEAGVELVRSAAKTLLNPCGCFKVEHWRNGKRINEYVFPNGITNEGKNKLLNVMFHGTTAVATWWLGLIDNSGYTALAATDTYDDINQVANGWDEFTSYTDAGNGGSASTRPQWNEGAASGQSITNSSPAVFDLTGAGTVKGVFLVGGDAGSQNKSDHTAGSTLWATALFTSGDVVVANGDQLKVTYTVSA
jgi:hypothetical protein